MSGSVVLVDELGAHLEQRKFARVVAAHIWIGRAEHAVRVVLEQPGMQIIVMEALRDQRLVSLHRPLEGLAEHCTQQEDQARKVERQLRKAASAAYLATRIGKEFDALVTGVTDRGTWVRTLAPPVEVAHEA